MPNKYVNNNQKPRINKKLLFPLHLNSSSMRTRKFRLWIDTHTKKKNTKHYFRLENVMEHVYEQAAL